MKFSIPLIASVSLVVSGLMAHAEIKPVFERNASEGATAKFQFKKIPAPSKTDAATAAKFTLVDGTRDNNGGTPDKLHDGKVPTTEDQPAGNFFFRAGTDGGRLSIDLGGVTDIQQVNTYSWHGGARGPQVYQLYASDGKAADFKAEPKKGTEPEKCGWVLVAKIDTRPKEGELGGQYGVSVANASGILGQYRYLLLDIARTEETDTFGNTFYSEIDVIDRNAPAVVAAVEPVEPLATATAKKTFTIEDGKYQFTMDTTAAPDLTEWAEKELTPVVKAWYPKIVAMLPSEGYTAPARVTILFREGMGGTPASAGGGQINCNIEWFRKNLKGEARGSVVHEMVHIVQQYGRVRTPGATRAPGWLVEGIPDYIRWFLYEPETKGAEIRASNLARARYDASYRVTGNFLNWATEKHDKNLVAKLNAAAREGKYDAEIWTKLTGHAVAELGEEWKKALETKLGVTPAVTPVVVAAANPGSAAPVVGEPKPNSLTDAETKAGWKLLFDGKALDGWHNFKSTKIRPGWQITNSTLACVDPRNAGDLCTQEQFGWFELEFDYNISEGGNSGIIYRVTEQGGTAWATGPEVQIEDNAKAGDPQRCGWLYGLYQPPIDPKTGKILDATKPAGQWNHVRILLSPEKCEHEINGVKYFEYVYGSDDFKQRVAKSKFGSMPFFAKADKGSIALQGDHGQVSFRSIKIRPIEAKK